MTDRDLLFGVLRAVLAIGEKLTGEKMAVTVRAGDGEIQVVNCDGDVKWLTSSAGQQPRGAAPPE